MFQHLQIYDPRERRLVGVADAALAVGAAIGRLAPRRRSNRPPERILLLRLERIGDLLMTLDAIALVREHAPSAKIDLVVGSWNEPIARLIADITRVETLDLPWVARGRGADWRTLWRRAREWRRRQYDLAINFEGDIRSHGLMALSRATRRVGFPLAGGAPLLTTVVAHDPRVHTSINAARLVDAAFGVPASEQPRASRSTRPKLVLPDRIQDQGHSLLQHQAVVASLPRDVFQWPLIGVHPAGGRDIKQWDPARFADVADGLCARTGGTAVITGSADDREVADRLLAHLRSRGTRAIDLVGQADLLVLAAVLQRLAIFITGDTGPMHLAAAMGTPVVAVFGPSDPARYAPLAAWFRVVRIDLPCAPCNRIRLPPERCAGHIPDCLAGVGASAVFEAAESLLASVPVVQPDLVPVSRRHAIVPGAELLP